MSILFVPCATCDGKGFNATRVTVYEAGCGFPHDDTEETPCEDCSGTGETEIDAYPIDADDLDLMAGATP